MLGLYVSDHPLNAWTHELGAESWASLSQVLDAEVYELPDRAVVTVGGMFTGLHRRSRGKNIWLVGTFEDQHRAVEAQAWPSEWMGFRWLANNTPVVIDAVVRRTDDRPMTLAVLAARRLERHGPGCLCEPPADEPEPLEPPVVTDHLQQTIEELREWQRHTSSTRHDVLGFAA